MENVGLNFFYNRKGKPEFSWFKVWDPDKYRFSRGKRVKFQYTSADLVSKEEIDIFDTISDNWKANQVVSYQYNEDRLLEVQQVKVWKDSGFGEIPLKLPIVTIISCKTSVFCRKNLTITILGKRTAYQ